MGAKKGTNGTAKRLSNPPFTYFLIENTQSNIAVSLKSPPRMSILNEKMCKTPKFISSIYIDFNIIYLLSLFLDK